MRRFSISAALFLLSPLLFAGQNQWTSNGPGTGFMSLVYVDRLQPDRAYAIAANGLYRTSDGGLNWIHSTDGHPGSAIASFAIGNDNTIFLSSGDALFVSDDGGASWAKRDNAGSAFLSPLAFDSAHGRLLAGTADLRAIAASSDGGRTWKKVAIPAAIDAPNIAIPSIAVSSSGVFAVVAFGPLSVLLRSTDGGDSWQIASDRAISNIVADPSNSTLFSTPLSSGGTILVSRDQGSTWTNLPFVPGGPQRSIASSGGSVFAATLSGVYVYDDNSKSWKQVGATLPVQALAVSSTTPRRIYATPDSGVVGLTEGQAAWTTLNTGLPGAAVRDVAVADVQPSTAYAATNSATFQTADGGGGWKLINDSFIASQLVVKPGTTDTLYAANSAYGFPGVLKSSDGGTTWKTLAPGPVTAFAIAPSHPQTLYAALTKAMSRSDDGGENWQPITSNIPLSYDDFYYGGFFATSAAVDPSNPSDVLVSKENGTFRTTSAGASWQFVYGQAVRSLSFDPSDPSSVFAAPYGFGVIRSQDGGATWSDPVGLTDKRVMTVAAGGGVLFAGTDDGHIYRSANQGKSWIGFDDGVIVGVVQRIAVVATRIYAATGAGVFQYETIDDGLNPLRLDHDGSRAARMLDASSAFVIPVVGTAGGVDGTLFTTELVLTNAGQSPQTVMITWLPRGGDGGPASFQLTIPAGSTARYFDLGERFSMAGIGSLIVAGVDATGAFDPNARIDASTRVWSGLTGGRAPVSQSVPAAHAELLGQHDHASVNGLKHDSQSRTNAGIVNLSSEPHQFTIQINGANASGQFTIEVPPFTLVQTALPEGDYGALSLKAFADAPGARWLLYGSSIDRSTGVGQTTIGSSYE